VIEAQYESFKKDSNSDGVELKMMQNRVLMWTYNQKCPTAGEQVDITKM
jgi:hypothetical protein